jgi:hypothetical protein
MCVCADGSVLDAFNKLALRFQTIEHAVDSVAGDIRVTRHAVDSVAKAVVSLNEEVMDPWTESNKSPSLPEDKQRNQARKSEKQALFKLSLCEFYDVPLGENLTCMLTGLKLPSKHITASHLMKKTKPGSLRKLGLRPDQISHPRNGLLLAEHVEAAFDAKDVCFEPVPLQNKFLRCCVLNPDILNKPVSSISSETFATHAQDKHLVLSQNKPFMRVLGYHYDRAMQRAYDNEWIGKQEFEDKVSYRDWSPDFKDETSLLLESSPDFSKSDSKQEMERKSSSSSLRSNATAFVPKI